MLKGKTVIFGVSGGIAAYKSVEIARNLVKKGATVKVIMTQAATKFITPLTFSTLTNQPVATGLFNKEPSGEIHHISLSDEADIVLVAPATANIIAKVANGIADDLLSTTILATDVPVIFAPSMNSRMYLNEITQKNIKRLEAYGYRMVGPAMGELACGEGGIGRLSETDAIVEAVEFEIARGSDLKGYSVMVTAGGTREPIDPVRFIGNKSSGKTGYAIANELVRRGSKTTLISSPTCLPIPQKVNFVPINTASDMHRETIKRFDKNDAIIMTAAVADFRPLKTHKEKIKKDNIDELSIKLKPNPDIIRELGEAKGKKILIAFAAESENLIENAQRKLERKNLDLIVANDISKTGIGFGEDFNKVTIIEKDGKITEFPRMTKRAIARIIVDKLINLVEPK